MKPHSYDLDYIRNFRRNGNVPAVRPEILAAKLQAVRNLEYPDLVDELAENPRLVELLWFIQAMSFRPGGLVQFTRELLLQFPERLGTDTMRQIGVPTGGQYKLEHCLQIWKSIPELYEISLCVGNSPFDQLLYEDLSEIRAVEKRGDAIAKEVKADLTPGYFWRACVDAAFKFLPASLAALCNEQDHGFRQNKRMSAWFIDGLIPTLFEMMERHAQQVGQGLAQTSVTQKVFRELDFAWSQKLPLAIVGDSRFGKTASVSVWCDMRPGRARLVTVPDSNLERDFFKAHADAFGISYTDQTSTPRLKDSVEFVLRHSGLSCVYDESHFLIPVSYSKTTPPKRLNWIRCQVIDRGLPCAFFSTPQTYRQTLGQFVKVTGYNMEQWIGRIPPTVILPAELNRDDLLAVAKINFPDIDSDYLELIAAKAMQAEGYLKNLEFTAKRARFIAQSQNRSIVSLEDVQEAIRDMLPALIPVAQAKARAAKKSAVEDPLQGDCAPLESPVASRQTSPMGERFSAAVESSDTVAQVVNRAAALVAA